jgi:hypothetical protein
MIKNYLSYERFRALLAESKQYSFEGSVLSLTNYHTGEQVNLDLAGISEDEYEELVVSGTIEGSVDE